MKKNLFVLPVILLALAGLLFVGCGDDSGGGDSVNTKALQTAITAAYDAKYQVMTATAANQVPQGRTWVTTAIMNTFDTAIADAEVVLDKPKSQGAVNSAITTLEAATATFTAAIGNGSAAAIKLSGTITLKNNGTPIRYISIHAHDELWENFREEVKVVTDEDGFAEWEIITLPLDADMTIYFRVMGFEDEAHSKSLVNIDYKENGEPFTIQLKDTDVENIDIDMEQISLITVSGTLKVDNVPNLKTVAIQLKKAGGDGSSIGDLVISTNGSNTAWSVLVEAFAAETDIIFSIVGSNSPTGATTWNENTRLFAIWDTNFGNTKLYNENKPGIALNLVTLSGKVTAKMNGQAAPGFGVTACKSEEVTEENTHDWWTKVGDKYYNLEWLASTHEINAETSANNASWYIVLPPFTPTQNILLNVYVYGANGSTIFDEWFAPVEVGTASKGNLNFDLGNYETVTFSGTINATFNGKAIPRVSIYVQLADARGWGYGHDVTLEAPAANAPWSVIIPVSPLPSWLDPEDFPDGFIPATVYIGVVANDNDGNTLFNWDDPEPRTYNSAGISGITINLGNYASYTMSGTINVNYGGATVPYLRISTWLYDAFNNSMEAGAVTLWDSAANSTWTITGGYPSTFIPDTVEISVYGDGDGWSFHKSIEVTFAATMDDIDLDLGDMSE